MFGLVNFANFIGDLISILMGFLVSVFSWISQSVSRFWLALVAIIGGALVWMADFILQLILLQLLPYPYIGLPMIL